MGGAGRHSRAWPYRFFIIPLSCCDARDDRRCQVIFFHPGPFRCAALAIRFPRFARRCNCESLARWSDHDVSFAVPKGSGTGNFTVCQLADSHGATNPHAGACFNHVRGWESTLLWHWHSARRETISMTEYRLMHTPPTCRGGDKSCTWLSGFDSLPHADTATVDTDV